MKYNAFANDRADVYALGHLLLSASAIYTIRSLDFPMGIRFLVGALQAQGG